MTQYLGKNVPNLAEVLQPMLEFLKKDTVWVMNEPQKKPFQRVKELLTQTPILIYYDPSKSIIINANAAATDLECNFSRRKFDSESYSLCLLYSYPNR